MMDIFTRLEAENLRKQLRDIRNKYLEEAAPIIEQLNKLERINEPRMTLSGDLLPYF